MNKSRNIERVVLLAAKAREDGSLLPFPKSVKLTPEAQDKLIRGLLKRRLAGLARTEDTSRAWKTDKRGEHLMPVISQQTAMGMMTEREIKEMGRKHRAEREAELKAGPAKQAPERITKIAIIIDMLRRKSGASINDLVKRTKWKPHSVRGALSGVLKKKHRLKIVGTSDKYRGRIYRVVDKL